MQRLMNIAHVVHQPTKHHGLFLIRSVFVRQRRPRKTDGLDRIHVFRLGGRGIK